MVRVCSNNIFIVSVYIILKMLIWAPVGISEKLLGTFTLIKHDTKFMFPDSEKLICKLSKSKNRVYEITWEYKQCGYGLDLVPCTQSENIPWKPFICTNHKNQTKPCDKPSLVLRNLTKYNSGLYKCIYRNYMSREFIDFKIFQLHVIDEKAEAQVKIVEDGPALDNQIKYVNETAFLRCRVRSLFPVSFMWAKLATENSNVNKLVKISDQKLEILGRGHEVKVNRDFYVSKLKIPSCQISDSGDYSCWVMPMHNGSYTSFKYIKSVSLAVLPPFTKSEEGSVFNLLWILVVIPIILLLIAAYACFIKIKCWQSLKQEIHYERS